MISSSGTDATPTSGDLGSSPEALRNWQQALVELVRSRVALIRLESQGAVRQGVRTAAAGVVAALALGFAWALLLVGGIGALAMAAHWPWYWIALAAALLHVGAAGLCAVLLRAAKAPTFPVTRNEFQKDREWLQNLKSPRK
jgi:uncharacterized membrane protein YqjE